MPPGMSESRATTAEEDSQATWAAVSQQAATMIANATRASETKVNTEMKRLEAAFMSISAKFQKVEAMLIKLDTRKQWVHKDTLSQILREVDQKWDQEIQAVKRELHQTILAHNHNADLMADHKALIEQIRQTVDAQAAALRPENHPLVLAQLDRLSHTLALDQERDCDLDLVIRRSEALHQHIAALRYSYGSTPHHRHAYQHPQSYASMVL